MKIISRVLCLFIFGTLSASLGHACSCVGPQNAKEGMVKAKAVFSGKVIKASEAEWLFQVERVWKGEAVARRAIVRASMPGTSCSSKFDMGERYIVFAFCGTRTRPDCILPTSLQLDIYGFERSTNV